jgi:group I intron endonuclease
MIIYTIYKIVNKINNKVYIGFTSKNPPNKRWITHLSQLNNPKYSKLALYKSIKKYGKEYFEFIIIYQSKDREHCLKVMEPYFIREYNSFGINGYNLTKGGEGTFGHNQIPWCKGKTGIHSPETLRKISERQKGNKNRVNKLHSQESKQKMSLSAYNRDHSYLQKRVLTPEGTFDSLTLASKHYNKSRSWMTKNLKTKPNLFYII